VEYFGFELGSESEPIDVFPPDLAPAARHVLAEALARFEARHPAVKHNRAAIEELRSVYRRSAGRTPRLGVPELTALYEGKLAHVSSLDEFRAADLSIDPDTIVPAAERARWLALPGTTVVREREVPIEYDVEDGTGVARLRLPEKLARSLVESELPVLDRPLRFVVPRGERGSVRAATLDELQELLDRPWSPEEAAVERERRGRREHRHHRGQRAGGKGVSEREREGREGRGERRDGHRGDRTRSALGSSRRGGGRRRRR
jgi:hypothetical protein